MSLRFLILVLVFFTHDKIYSQLITCNNSPIPVFYNQQNVTFNQENSTVEITNFVCDPCKTGLNFNECNRFLLCESQCNHLIPENADQQIQECQKKCLNEPDQQVQALCISGCHGQIYYDYYQCLFDCGGGFIPIIKQPISQISNIRIWYTKNLTIPYFYGNPNYNVTYPIRSYEGQNLTFNLNYDFGDDPLSYCIVTETIIKYSDGSCCRFINYFCANLG